MSSSSASVGRAGCAAAAFRFDPRFVVVLLTTVMVTGPEQRLRVAGAGEPPLDARRQDRLDDRGRPRLVERTVHDLADAALRVDEELGRQREAAVRVKEAPVTSAPIVYSSS